jgi:hypothetical protein
MEENDENEKEVSDELTENEQLKNESRQGKG